MNINNYKFEILVATGFLVLFVGLGYVLYSILQLQVLVGASRGQPFTQENVPPANESKSIGFVGTIKSIRGDGFALTTAAGPISIVVSSQTQIFSRSAPKDFKAYDDEIKAYNAKLALLKLDEQKNADAIAALEFPSGTNDTKIVFVDLKVGDNLQVLAATPANSDGSFAAVEIRRDSR